MPAAETQLASAATFRLVDSRAVAGLLDVDERTLRRMISAQRFPSGLRIGIGSRARRWRLGDVEQWIAQRASEEQAR